MATNIIKSFKKGYPKVDFELLLGNYMEIEGWVFEGRVNFSFTIADKSRTQLEKWAKAEIGEIFAKHHILPEVHFTTRDDHAIMSMVKNGQYTFELFLQRVPYRIYKLEILACRYLGIAMGAQKISVACSQEIFRISAI